MTRLCEISLEACTRTMVNSTSNRFVWYELLTTNVSGAKAFYADVVGWGARDVSIPDRPIISLHPETRPSPRS